MVRKLIKLQNAGLLYRLRELIYYFGGRPKAGSIWCSPSLAYLYSFNDARKKFGDTWFVS